MNSNFCPCLSGGQCRISKEEFGRKLEAKELKVASRIRLDTGISPMSLLGIFAPERFGANARHRRKVKIKLKKMAEQKGFDHVRSDGILQNGISLDEYIIQGFTFFREETKRR